MKFQEICHICIKPIRQHCHQKIDRTMPFAADFLHPSFTFRSDFDQILESSLARNVSHQCYVDLCYIFGTRNLQFISLALFLHFSCIFLQPVKCIYATLIYFFLGGLRFGKPQLTKHIKVIENSLVGILRKSETAEICH